MKMQFYSALVAIILKILMYLIRSYDKRVHVIIWKEFVDNCSHW